MIFDRFKSYGNHQILLSVYYLKHFKIFGIRTHFSYKRFDNENPNQSQKFILIRAKTRAKFWHDKYHIIIDFSGWALCKFWQ